MDDTDVRVQVRFTIEQDGLSYSDALYYTLAEYGALTDKQLDVDRRARFDAWRSVLAEQPEVESPSPEEQLAAIDAELQRLQAERAAVLDAVAADPASDVGKAEAGKK